MTSNIEELIKSAKNSLAIGDTSNALKLCQQTIQLAPNNEEARLVYGQVLINLGKHTAALDNYYHLLRLNPSNIIVRSKIRALHLMLVNRWHFPMLNDELRNTAFEKAITEAIKPNMTVLEIGTGSGLLAMIAARAGAAHVYTCEQSLPLARTASQIIKRNNLSDKITIINRWSHEIVVGKDIPKKADILIAEIFGSSLIDEHLFRFFNHARDNLLVPNASVIPAGGEIFGMLIESEVVRKKVKVDSACGFDLKLFNALYDEPNIQVDLNKEEHKKLSLPFSIFSYDFNQDLKSNENKICEVNVTKNGLVSGVVMWFKLELDSNNSISTSPESDSTHWEQMVQIFDKPFEVKSGTTIKLMARNFDDRIVFSLVK